MTDAESARQAADPGTPLEVLAELAYAHPELRAVVAANPSTYPDLLEWLANLGDPDVDQALRRRNGEESDDERASNPATPPEVLAELAYQHPELRAAIAANPSAYDGLREWIAAAGMTQAIPAAMPSVSAPVRPAFLTRVNNRFGMAFTPRSATITAAVAIVSVVSMLGTGVLSTSLSNTAAGHLGSLLAQVGDTLDNAPGIADGAQRPDSTGTPDESATPATQSAPKPEYLPTVLILDASGSMVRAVPDGGTRMAAARTAATTFINGLGDGAQVGLTVFGTSTGNQESDRAAGCFDITTLVPVGEVDKAQFTGAIAGISESGFTPLGPAMRNASEQLAGFERAQIVLVSDGVDTCSPPAACDIATELRSERPGLTIHAVGFAVDADEQAQEQLACIASVGGGEYVDAASADQLAARLRAISDPISTAGAVHARGFENLSLGMSVDQAMSADPSVTLGKVTVDIQYAECDDAVLTFKNGRLYDIRPKTPAPTADGLTVGDDIARAVSLYGTATEGSDGDGSYAVFPAARGSDSGYRVYYEPASPGAVAGKVIRIVLCICGPGGGTVSEISTWQLSFDGLGPLTLPMSPSEVRTIAPGMIEDVECGGNLLATSGLGAQVELRFSGYSADSVYNAYRVLGSPGIAADRLPKTPAGIGIGSTLRQVQAAYPALTVVQPQGSGRYGIVTDARGHSLIFEFDGGDRVSLMQTGIGTVVAGSTCD